MATWPCGEPRGPDEGGWGPSGPTHPGSPPLGPSQVLAGVGGQGRRPPGPETVTGWTRGLPAGRAGAIEPETCVGWGGGGLATLLPLARPNRRPLSRGRRKGRAGPWGLTDAPLR